MSMRRAGTYRQILRQKWAWYGTLGVLGCMAFTVAALVTFCVPFSPEIHDEFANLLVGDTLLHGRLANPTPEVWEPFQTFHVIMQPSYAAKYPLGAGLLVALGRLTLVYPVAGSWLAAGFAVICATWMFAGLVSRRWAILGGTLLALHPSLQLLWSQSLLGAWLTAGAASLVAGGTFRLRRRFAWRHALALGVGVGGLALSRPFEGLVFTAACVVPVALSYPRSVPWKGRWRYWSRVACGMAAPVFAALALVVTHNIASTGAWYRMPHQVHEQSYGVAPVFRWGTPREPDLSGTPQVFEKFHQGWSLDSYLACVGYDGWMRGIEAVIFGSEAVAGLLLVILMAPMLLFVRSRMVGQIMFGLAVQMYAATLICWVLPHYLAPVLVWMAVLAVLGLRLAWHRWLRSAYLSFGLVTVQLAWLVFAVSLAARQSPINWLRDRVTVLQAVQREPGQHLILVHYSPTHNVHQEWVYNEADFQRARVLWAHADREDWVQKLQSVYGHQRTIWELDPDQPESLTLVSTPNDEASWKPSSAESLHKAS